jgi:hypothetical protein
MIIWEPEGIYGNLFDIFCNMRDRDLLKIVQHCDSSGATTYYELHITTDKKNLFMRYLNYLLKTRIL